MLPQLAGHRTAAAQPPHRRVICLRDAAASVQHAWLWVGAAGARPWSVAAAAGLVVAGIAGCTSQKHGNTRKRFTTSP